MSSSDADLGEQGKASYVDVERTVRALGKDHDDIEPVIAEVPVALVFNGISHAVMMATPADLEDYARGFAFSEGIVERPEHILDVVIGDITPAGVVVEVSITNGAFYKFKEHRRNLAGTSGCGLCGKESLSQVIRPLPRLAHLELPAPAALEIAVASIRDLQRLAKITSAAHAAAWCSPSGEILALREDVGRHNALDKLIGWRGRKAEPGFALVSSRASYEMVTKAAMSGIGVMVAVSAPTSLAVSSARESGVRLVAFTTHSRHVIYA